MIINEIGIRGYKSFGNNEQVVKMSTDEGKLILLVGNNGNGKSSFLESFEWSFYGKVKSNKVKKWHTLSSLPNRINGELLTRISFKADGVDVEIKRGISPNKLELWENGVLNEKAGKSNINDKIEKYVNMDIETFKSFISMSINDFKNFISLTNEEKKLLLDKLFNLETINILNSILKDIVKGNKSRIVSLDSEISTLKESISSIQKSIEKTKEKEKLNVQQEIDELMESMSSRKEEYKALKVKVDKIEKKDKELNFDLDSEKKQLIITQSDIRVVDKEINLYDLGKCPTCSTDFFSEHFTNLKSTLVEKKESLNSIKLEIEKTIKTIRNNQTKLKKISDSVTLSFNDLRYLLKSYKSQIEKLNSKKIQESVTSVSIEEFEDSIKEFDKKKTVSEETMTTHKEKELYYKEINRVLGDEGVKKSIISSIVKPINHFIKENIKSMKLPFDVKLDETFTAEIKSLGSVIDPNSLSTGETKLINIAILVAYLKLIRTKKHINILFLDEVFSSIDLENIENILMLLKSFSNEYNINIFVVHHAILNQEMFDRIVSIEKNIFSEIKEVDIKKLD